MILRSLILLFAFSCNGLLCVAQQTVVIGFWNLENLYDTIDDPLKDDDEFTPDGKNRWNTEKYTTKLLHLAEVIAGIGTDHDSKGISLIGLCEVENRTVLKDLVRQKSLSEKAFEFVHVESEDARGIDVALMYKTSVFKVDHVKPFQVRLPDTAHKTRPVLLVAGAFKGKPLTVLVNHWPSRRGGERASQPSRIAAANITSGICDSLLRSDPAAAILLMGDFNDDPLSYSIRKILHASGMQDSGRFYNPYDDLYKKGIGSLAFNDRWNLFDQIIMTNNLVKGKSWTFISSHVYAPDYLRTQRGKFRGYPFRTFSGGVYTGGYSDHFPSYTLFKVN